MRYWSLLDASVLHLLDKDLFSTVIPSKLFESMAMGVPVLSSVPGETAQIVREHDAGVQFKAEDAGDLARVILELKNSPDRLMLMKRRCVAAACVFDRVHLAQVMAAELQTSLAG